MRFGILGWGKIARTQLAPAIIQAGHEVVAIGSRSPEAATLAWSEAHAPVRWTGYEGVLNDPRVGHSVQLRKRRPSYGGVD